MTRNPDAYSGPGKPVAGDVDDEATLRAAMVGCEVAYYLVHGMDESSGPDLDGDRAERFGLAAAANELRQIIYLGGLGAEGDDLSDHLASRREVEGRLARSGVPLTVLRAALVIGAGSASFELLRQVVAHLPVLVIPPQASSTRVQPIAARDAVDYLVGVLDLPAARGRILEIGGSEVLTYAQMLRRTAAALEVRRPHLSLPTLPDTLTKWGISIFTDVDPQLALNLLHSLGNDVIVEQYPIDEVLPCDTMSFDQMLEEALADERSAD